MGPFNINHIEWFGMASNPMMNFTRVGFKLSNLDDIQGTHYLRVWISDEGPHTEMALLDHPPLLLYSKKYFEALDFVILMCFTSYFELGFENKYLFFFFIT